MIELTDPTLGCYECWEPLGDCGCLDGVQALFSPVEDFFAGYDAASEEAAWKAPSIISRDYVSVDVVLDLKTTPLYASQQWVLTDVVAEIAVALCHGKKLPPPRLVAHSEGFCIIDGHHRLAAVLSLGVPIFDCVETLV
jgi:hypothetical protein